MDGRVAIDTPSGQPPAVVLDSPAEGAHVAGLVNISGWALDSEFRPESKIWSVVVYVDNVQAGYTTYGFARPDVCNVHRSRPGCP